MNLFFKLWKSIMIAQSHEQEREIISTTQQKYVSGEILNLEPHYPYIALTQEYEMIQCFSQG